MLVTSLLCSSDRVWGQTGGFSPSADQIEMFKNLSPQQQQAIRDNAINRNRRPSDEERGASHSGQGRRLGRYTTFDSAHSAR